MPVTPLHDGPEGLSSEARELWAAISAGYQLRPDELRVLEDACRTVDVIERLEEALRDAPLVVDGSKGQVAVNPLVSEIRQHRQVLRSLLGALRLPDEDDARPALSGSTAARQLAMQRWRRA